MLLHVLATLLCAILATLSHASIDSSSKISQLVRRNSTGLTNAVTWDPHSLSIQGQRTFILSAEFHPWRLPNPNLWADIFQKIRANGFNTVSFYAHWALHYPAPDTNVGAGDFQAGTYRDIQRFIDEAKNAGLWLIARPGPYINGETTGGGFPGWVGTISGSLRTDNPNYTQADHKDNAIPAWTLYMTQISKLIAKNQITNGGPIILVQAENEFSEGTDRSPYMQAIIDIYRVNGIVILGGHTLRMSKAITFNDQHSGQNGNFSPDRPGTGRVNIYCGDSYPQSNSWAQVQAIYYSYHEASAPSNPTCLAEFGGGWLLGWGSVARGGTGYEKYTGDLSGPAYEDIFYKENYAQTATILNIYMLFGGTNWGQTAEPTVYTSYDYGGGINENRVATAKMNEMRLQGLFLRVSRDLLATNLLGNGTNYTSSSLIHTAELRNLQTNAGFYIIRHDSSPSTALTTTQLNVTTSAGLLTIPRNGTITLNGRESKILVTDYIFGLHQTNILYSTAEIFTWTTIDQTDYVLLYVPTSQDAEVTFTFSGAPSANLANAPGVSISVESSSLTLNTVVSSTVWVTVTVSNRVSTVLVVTDKATAGSWHAPVIPGSGTFGNYFSIGTNETVLVSGPYVVRSATIKGSTLALVGDTNGTTHVEVVAPSRVKSVTWNGDKQLINPSSYGSLQFTTGTKFDIAFPDLSKQSWKVSGSLPEIDPDFDDSSFITANQTATNFTNLPPLSGEQVLYSQQYGFYGGNLIFRGHFTASGSETAVNLTVQGGLAFAYSAFINGVFIGSGGSSASLSMTSDVWTFPEGSMRVGKDNVLTVIQDHMGIVETSTNSGKEPRGIRGYSLIGGNTTFTTWKIQGNQGGAANAPDTYRGYLNEGGLYAERIGAHLPGFPDSEWADGSPISDGVKGAGVNFYRTTFTLNLPKNTDVPIRLSITPSAMTSHFRVQIYLNGWMLGKYINDIGILTSTAPNTLALSLWSLSPSGASLAGLELIADGAFSSGFEIQDLESKGWEDQRENRPKDEMVGAM
ncbi:glycoside hydrolase family 35 protein [Irpex rosettiformis]|uniref:Glycoside hydrolase family 35 protein n=1 Tax=Irpex rosettiformis TaxID=378272 RepID=A0ACB8UC89_9APHY|nr:glycoside hydrolase family 35 protein [Irpex rosettiformis]